MAASTTTSSLVAYHKGNSICLNHAGGEIDLAELSSDVTLAAHQPYTKLVAYEKAESIFIHKDGEEVWVAEFNPNTTSLTDQESRLPWVRQKELMEQKLSMREATVDAINRLFIDQCATASSQAETVATLVAPESTKQHFKNASGVANVSQGVFPQSTLAKQMSTVANLQLSLQESALQRDGTINILRNIHEASSRLFLTSHPDVASDHKRQLEEGRQRSIQQRPGQKAEAFTGVDTASQTGSRRIISKSKVAPIKNAKKPWRDLPAKYQNLPHLSDKERQSLKEDGFCANCCEFGHSGLSKKCIMNEYERQPSGID